MKEIELIHKRTANEKHFLLEDGTIAAKVFEDNIHYLKNGVFEEIDNTLTKKIDHYENKSNDYKVSYSINGNDYLFNLKKGDYYVNVKLNNSKLPTMSKKNSQTKLASCIIYNNILDNVDIKYETLPTKIKETIILNEQIKGKISFVIETNLSLKLKDNYIIAENNSETILTIDKLFMKDSNGNVNNNVKYILNGDIGKYTLELELDDDWLKSSTTMFPVYIDPTITTNTNSNAVYDTYIYPGDNGIDKNSQDILKAGVERVNNSNIINRTLIKFDLPVLGTGSEVINARLVLTGYPTTDLTNNNLKTVAVHRVTTSWTETGATWDLMANNYDSTRVESLQLIKRSELSNGIITPYYSDYDDITDLVKHWYKDTDNYGILLKSVDENYIDDNYPAFFSKNNTVQGINPQPLLIITYRNQNGLEKYLNYEKQPFTSCDTYVNTYNGNLVGIFNITSTIGSKMPANLTLVYNTNDVVISQNGFMFNYNQVLKDVTIDNNNLLEYRDADGTLHYFYQDSTETNKYYDEDNLNVSIEKSGIYCYMKDSDNTILTFENVNNIYYLKKIQDTSQNEINITYDSNNRITKIVDSSNEEINITYSTTGITIVDPNNTSNIYLDNNKVTSIVTKYGTTQITYDNNNLISSIIDVSGLKRGYEYYEKSPFKLKKITQYSLNNTVGEYFTMEYGFNVTTIVDNSNIKNTLIFNSLGNLISINSVPTDLNLNKAYSVEKKYGSENYQKNKMLSNSVPVRHIKNFISNSSFEENDNFFNSCSYGATMSYSNSYAVSGKRSLQISTNAPNEFIIGSNLIEYDTSPKFYTFSGYFKGNQDFTITLMADNVNNEGIEISKEFKASDDFERHDITIYCDNLLRHNITVRINFNTSGVTYLDDIQLETGEIANNYNIITNSDFSEGINDWTFTATNIDTNVDINPSTIFEPTIIDGNRALKVKMNPSVRSSFKKDFPVTGSQGDVYNISFWLKNEGLVGNDPNDDIIMHDFVGNSVIILFHPTDGRPIEYCVFHSPDFIPNNKWQYVSFRYDADTDYDYISLIFNQRHEANNMYITNLTLYKDLSTNDYSYNSKGKIVECANLNSLDKKHQFDYDNRNSLINYNLPKGNGVSFEYSNDSANRVISTIYDNGLTKKYKYDSNGNIIKTKITNTMSTDIINGQYRIRCKGTDSYLKAEYRSVFIENDTCSNTVWNIERIINPELEDWENNTYKIVYSNAPRYLLRCDNNEIELGTIDSNNLFELEKNKNKSYRIKLAGDYKYLKANNNGTLSIVNTLDEDDPSYEFYLETLDEEFIEMNATYSQDGKFLETITDSLGNVTTYNTNPSTGLLTSKEDASGVITSYQYNNKNQITSITRDNKTISYDYNNNNQISKVTVDNTEYNLEYDEFLNAKSVKIGNSITLINNQFEANNGNLSASTYGNGNTISYEYDELNRVNYVEKMDANYTYEYDSNGNISKIMTNKVTPDTSRHTRDVAPIVIPKWYDSMEKYVYDSAKRLSEYENDDFNIKYKYDINDNVINRKYKFINDVVTINNTFDSNDNLVNTTINNDTVDYQYDSLQRLTKRTINNDYDTIFKYVSLGNKTTQLIESIQNGNDKFSYAYDKLGNITSIYKNSILTNEYFYDSYNELVAENDIPKNQRIEYQYDSNGNMITKTTKNYTTSVVLSVDNFTYQNSNWKDQLTSYNNMAITYDQIGNPLTIGNDISMSWVNGRQLKTYVSTSKNLNISYEYDYSGIRKSKTINGNTTRYYTENDRVIYEDRNGTTIKYLYDSNGLFGINYSGNNYYYVKNIQNDIIGILDSNYQQIVFYEYDSWGKLISIKDNNGLDITNSTNIGIINPFRYRSYYYDTETALYYLNSRYYNPEICRFINSDSYLGQNLDIMGYNLYTYVSNNPINNYDSTGYGKFNLLGNIKKGLNSLKKKVEKTFNDIGKKAAQVKKEAYKFACDVVKKVDDACNWVKEHFVFEAEYGLGFEAGGQVGPIEGKAGFSKNTGVRWQNGESHEYTNTEGGISMKILEQNIGISGEVRNYDEGYGNMMAMPWEVWDDENTTKAWTLGIDSDKSKADVDMDSSGDRFIGFSIDAYLLVGGKIKIGFSF